MRVKGNICKSSCKNPANKTPHASANTGISKNLEANTAKIIKVKLKIRGVAAGTEKELCEF